MRDVLGDGSQYGIRLRFVEEPDPRGTAGALKFAEDLPRRALPHAQRRRAHRSRPHRPDRPARGDRRDRARWRSCPSRTPRATASCACARTTPSRSSSRSRPPTPMLDTNLISAGAYVLERSVLDMIAPDKNVSIEREVWPALVDHGLYGYVDDNAYWIDVGTPAALPAGDVRHPRGQRPHATSQAALGDGFLAVDPSARVDGRVGPARGRRAPARRSPRARTSAASPCIGRRRAHRRRLDRRARGRAATARGSASTASCATASSAPGARHRRPQPGHRRRDARRRRQDRRRQRRSRAVRACSPAWRYPMAASPSESTDLRLDAREHRGHRPPRPISSRTSRPSPSTCATRNGRPSPRS